jgi:hypothetical protein
MRIFPKLRYLKKTGDKLFLSFYNINADMSRGLQIFETLDVLDPKSYERLLRSVDEDIDRYKDAIDIVEQVVGYVFRGKYRKIMTQEAGEGVFKLVCAFLYAFGDEYLSAPISVVYGMYFWLGEKTVFYEGVIKIAPWYLYELEKLDETSRGLYERLLEELAEIFENQKITMLKDMEAEVTLYRNERRFRLRFAGSY